MLGCYMINSFFPIYAGLPGRLFWKALYTGASQEQKLSGLSFSVYYRRYQNGFQVVRFGFGDYSKVLFPSRNISPRGYDRFVCTSQDEAHTRIDQGLIFEPSPGGGENAAEVANACINGAFQMKCRKKLSENVDCSNKQDGRIIFEALKTVVEYGSGYQQYRDICTLILHLKRLLDREIELQKHQIAAGARLCDLKSFECDRKLAYSRLLKYLMVLRQYSSNKRKLKEQSNVSVAACRHSAFSIQDSESGNHSLLHGRNDDGNLAKELENQIRLGKLRYIRLREAADILNLLSGYKCLSMVLSKSNQLCIANENSILPSIYNRMRHILLNASVLCASQREILFLSYVLLRHGKLNSRQFYPVLKHLSESGIYTVAMNIVNHSADAEQAGYIHIGGCGPLHSKGSYPRWKHPMRLGDLAMLFLLLSKMNIRDERILEASVAELERATARKTMTKFDRRPSLLCSIFMSMVKLRIEGPFMYNLCGKLIPDFLVLLGPSELINVAYGCCCSCTKEAREKMQQNWLKQRMLLMLRAVNLLRKYVFTRNQTHDGELQNDHKKQESSDSLIDGGSVRQLAIIRLFMMQNKHTINKVCKQEIQLRGSSSESSHVHNVFSIEQCLHLIEDLVEKYFVSRQDIARPSTVQKNVGKIIIEICKRVRAKSGINTACTQFSQCRHSNGRHLKDIQRSNESNEFKFFFRNVEIEMPLGPFVLDFAFPLLQVAIEVDGECHFYYGTNIQTPRTLLKRDLLEFLGWVVIQIPAEKLRNKRRSYVLNEIRSAVTHAQRNKDAQLAAKCSV